MEIGWPLVAGLAVVIALAAVGSLLLKKGEGEEESKKDAGEALPYRKREWLLDHASEKDFFAVLEKAATAVLGPCRVMVQVQLSRLIEVPSGTDKWQSWKNKIDRKSVDYVVCEAGTLRPLLAVELDGTSHDSQKAKKRDGFVDKALEGAGVKLIRVDRRGKALSVEEVAERVRGVVGEPMPMPSHRHATRS